MPLCNYANSTRVNKTAAFAGSLLHIKWSYAQETHFTYKHSNGKVVDKS